jgi:hypothetical protein
MSCCDPCFRSDANYGISFEVKKPETTSPQMFMTFVVQYLNFVTVGIPTCHLEDFRHSHTHREGEIVSKNAIGTRFFQRASAQANPRAMNRP